MGGSDDEAAAAELAPDLGDGDVAMVRWGGRRGIGRLGRKVDCSHVGVLGQVGARLGLAGLDDSAGARL